MTYHLAFLSGIMFFLTIAASEPLRVCASVPDLANLAHHVGGHEIQLTTFARGTDDPHYIELRPSFITALARADVLIEIGLEMEIGWLPPAVHQAGNARLNMGQPGRIIASDAIQPLGIPTGAMDRSHGDVHAHGNPHFLMDPVCGAQVARLLRDRFSRLRPESADIFAANASAFEKRLAEALVGEAVANALGPLTIIDRIDQGTLSNDLADQGLVLGGWSAALVPKSPDSGLSIVCDHDLWPYFARRFGIHVVGFLEPMPGIPPTPRHLNELRAEMKRLGVRIIVSSPYYDPKPARRMAEVTDSTVIVLAHQVGALPNTDDYVDCLAYDIQVLAAAQNKLMVQP